MGYGSIKHVAKIIEFMAQVLNFFPAFLPRPRMWILRVHRACCVEIAVRFLCFTHDIEYTVDVIHELFVGKTLQHIACTLDSFVDIGIVKRIKHELFNDIFVVRVGGFFKVFVAVFAFTFAESQGNSHLLCRFYAVAEE